MSSGADLERPSPEDDLPQEDLVECRRVSRRYRARPADVLAVSDADCWVSPGMLVALTGPSGSGKSSLLHLLAGLERPTSGRISWPALGGVPRDLPGAVAMMFQGPSLLPDLDVIENVGLPLLLTGEPAGAATARAAEMLRTVGIAELGAKLPEELSGGQAQRVALARALVTRPRLILADEPTGQLDRATGSHVISVLRQAALEFGAGLVVATHDHAVADRFDVRWRMCNGRLAAAEDVGDRATPSAGVGR
ncbi:MAG TPA: ATP-binding cassette domain-containing protein [Pseudonocardia sp.]